MPSPTTQILARTLQAGDRFVYADVSCVVVEPAPTPNASDRFGRDMHQIIATRTDTRHTGPLMFGPNGVVEPAPEDA